MIFCVSNENEERFDFDICELAGDVGNAAILKGIKKSESAMPRKEFLVNLMLTDDSGIQKINADTRGIDASTDVLSFPAFSFETPGLFMQEAMDALEVQDLETGNTWLGDVIISADHVRSQSAEYGHGEKREFAFLLTHAMFHLMGYDHETKEEAAFMEKLQESVLDSLRITR